MSHSDDVREYCINNIIEPARIGGEREVVIGAVDIHTAMAYRNRMPLVCAALGAKKFEDITGVERVSLTGPTNGANAIFTFRIN